MPIQRVRGICRGFLKMLKPLENQGILNRELYSSLLCYFTCIFSQSLNTFTVCQLWRLEGLYTTSQSLGWGRKQQVSTTQTPFCIPIYSCNCLWTWFCFSTDPCVSTRSGSPSSKSLSKFRSSGKRKTHQKKSSGGDSSLNTSTEVEEGNSVVESNLHLF